MSLVGYSSTAKTSKLSLWDRSAAGGLSGAVSRLILQPLDVAKIRLQLQVESGGGRTYSGLLHLLARMPREEGIKSLWKGHVPAQILSISYGLSELKDKRIDKSNGYFSAGCVGTFVSFPFDVIRTRMVAQPETRRIYSSLVDAVYKLNTEGGFRAFYKGFGPTMVAMIPQTGLQFGFYSLFSQVMSNFVTVHDHLLGHEVMTVLGSLSCGGLAGVCAKLSIYPLDTVKKRLQVSGWEKGRAGLGITLQYKGAVHCTKDILQREGARGLFKGVLPALVKSAANSSLNFWLYENFSYLLALRLVER
ncbi:mitochondrial thiamine pyrophosphate carrier [Eurytemora carolleeae]|uniref:mitochondrial thiamine pyrophosphate carrier n=1 Tax=Eurytemora carolleeae TaxID=1294199 RepID=UPI000C775A2C|nr:mitochondrial thiamine pyrophosphate carrier [Eurytemora carolleeae]|eukprot:XP_023347299.1 mitochondrial thiamine pyrophosphate carrier-like [Eurytemora affinis]